MVTENLSREEIPADVEVLDENALREVEDDGHDTEGSAETAMITRPGFAPANPATQRFAGTISLPWLQVVHGVGKLAKSFSPGDLVLGGPEGDVLYSPPKAANKNAVVPPLRLIVVNFTQYFKEYLSRELSQAGQRPRIFRTAAEAHAAGLTTEWDNITRKPPSAPAAMTWCMLIEKPEGAARSERFCLEDKVDGTIYAPAFMALDKGAYLSVKDTFGTAANWTVKDRGIDSVVWTMITRIRRASTGNEVWVPAVRMVEHLKDDKLIRMRNMLSGG